MKDNVLRRTFLGEIITRHNYHSFSKMERRLHNKHLKAYLRGEKKFYYGKDEITHEPIEYKVEQHFYYE